MSAIYIADEDAAQIKALLTLAADGLAAEVLDGTEQEKSAVTLGRLLGRDRVQLVLTCRGDERRYDWPTEWDRAIADHARATAAGATVEARREELAGSGPPKHDRRPRGRSGDVRAVTTGRGCDSHKDAPQSRSNPAGAPPIFIADVDASEAGTTTGGVR
ncbi:MAG: hypothetical protein KY440_03435 [Actinobacteria bacterium]|nr:hypothetical protein [Actinomycetota bacterium]